MIGKYVRVRVTKPITFYDQNLKIEYMLNFGKLVTLPEGAEKIDGAYIMGIHHPVKNFDGRVIAAIHSHGKETVQLVVAPKSTRFIINEIKDAISFAHPEGTYEIECLYERSCGAVVYRIINNEIRFLLIKNNRSAHWGFPKGHIEKGESKEDTAAREVFEETGIHIEIVPDFVAQSEYTIQGKVEKTVTIFLARTNDTQTTIQREEIEDYVWLNFDAAMKLLKFENDRRILNKAKAYLDEKNENEL